MGSHYIFVSVTSNISVAVRVFVRCVVRGLTTINFERLLLNWIKLDVCARLLLQFCRFFACILLTMVSPADIGMHRECFHVCGDQSDFFSSRDSFFLLSSISFTFFSPRFLWFCLCDCMRVPDNK